MLFILVQCLVELRAQHTRKHDVKKSVYDEGSTYRRHSSNVICDTKKFEIFEPLKICVEIDSRTKIPIAAYLWEVVGHAAAVIAPKKMFNLAVSRSPTTTHIPIQRDERGRTQIHIIIIIIPFCIFALILLNNIG